MAQFKRFRSSPRAAAVYQPSVAPPLPCKEGVPLGREVVSGQVVYCDPHTLRLLNIISSTIFLIVGNKGKGKSAFMKMLIGRFLLMQGAITNGLPALMHARVSDRKIEGEAGEGEYFALTDWWKSKPIAINRRASLNILHYRMHNDVYEVLEMAVDVCEMVKGAPLENFERQALTVAVYKMWTEYRTGSSVEALQATANTITITDKNHYDGLDSDNTLEVFARQGIDLAELAKLKHVMGKENNTPAAEFERDAALVAGYLGDLRGGAYGRFIGGLSDFREELKQPVATFDQSGMSMQARILFEGVMTRFHDRAFARQDYEVLPNVMVRDEELKAFDNVVYARSQAAQVMEARASRTIDLRSVLYEPSFEQAGAEGSEIRGLAQSILRGVGGRFYFRLPDDDAVRHSLYQKGVQEHDATYITRDMPVGQTAWVMEDWPLIYVDILPVDDEWELIKSDAAAKSMVVDRREVSEMEEYYERRHQMEQLALAGGED
jgi:hypothetical protein